MKRPILFLITIIAFLLSGGTKPPAIYGAGGKKSAGDETADLQKKLRKNPKDARLRVKLGMAFLQKETYDAALAQFDSALALQPDFAAAKFGRAEAKFLQGQLDEGMRGYLEVLGASEGEQYGSLIAGRIGVPYAIRQITFPPGENMMARFSVDGRAIVFQSNRDGNWEIYRAHADGSQPVRLTNDPASRDESPCFSPDGRWIAFAAAQSQNGASGKEAAREIYLMEAETGANLTCITRHRADDWSPAFSPKGDRLAFVSDRDDARAVELQERQSDIFLFSLSDSSLTRFSQGFGDKSAPCFTPDGAALVHVNNVNGVFDIFEQKLESAQPASVVTKNGPKGAPQVSPDGKWIIYFEKRDNNFDLFLSPRAKGNVQRLTRDAGVDAFPTFSPDGNEIFFASNRDGGYQIYAVNLRQPISPTELTETLRRMLDPQRPASQ